jgi:hypothetical protein
MHIMSACVYLHVRVYYLKFTKKLLSFEIREKKIHIL